MPLGDFSKRCNVVAARQQTDAQIVLFARLPEPVERTVSPPAFFMRLAEGESKSEHARPFTPVRNDIFAIRALQIEMSENAKFFRMQTHRFDCEFIDRFTERAGRMNHRAINTG